MLFYCCVASAANEQHTILNGKKIHHWSLWTSRRWMNLRSTVFALSGMQRMMCVVGIFAPFAVRSFFCYRTLGWVYQVKFYFFSVVEVFIKVIIVLAFFSRGGQCAFMSLKALLCANSSDILTWTTETIDGILIDGIVMYLIRWSQKLFLIFLLVREPRIVKCESRSGEKE